MTLYMALYSDDISNRVFNITGKNISDLLSFDEDFNYLTLFDDNVVKKCYKSLL